MVKSQYKRISDEELKTRLEQVEKEMEDYRRYNYIGDGFECAADRQAFESWLRFKRMTVFVQAGRTWAEIAFEFGMESRQAASQLYKRGEIAFADF